MRSSGPFEIRPARSTDAAGLTAVLHDTFESTWLPNITSSAAKAFWEEDRPAAYIARYGHEFWVCQCAENIVGFVHWQGDSINALHVHGSCSRSGVGTLLMDKAEAEIRRLGFASARLETDTFNRVSQRFYSKRGYIEADRYPDTEWGSNLVTILLVKPLQ
jgi:ribosomal protein S18 acetylase RimI-like enzyme